jgi:hypothetical protein
MGKGRKERKREGEKRPIKKEKIGRKNNMKQTRMNTRH